MGSTNQGLLVATHHNHSHHSISSSNEYHRAFIIGICLNLAFIIAEIIFGLQANSVALLADAGHNASDVIGLFIAWGAMLLQKRKPSERFTYGLQSGSIMAALMNAVLLLVVTGSIGWESLQRLFHPEPSANMTIIIVASIGIMVNGLTALLFLKGSKHDLNVKGAYLHMAADAAISLGVVLAGGIMYITGWLWVDPLTSLLISVLIIWGTWDLFKESLILSLHAVPSRIQPKAVKSFLQSQPNVAEVHDLHIWAMSTQDIALSAHLYMPGGHPGDDFICSLNKGLNEQFQINHATIQIEISNTQQECHLAHHHNV